MSRRTVRVEIHREADGYWAQAVEFPGCFATGATLDELIGSLTEGIGVYLSPTRAAGDVDLDADDGAAEFAGGCSQRADADTLGEHTAAPTRYLTRVTELRLIIEPDLRLADPDQMPVSPASGRKRQSHREDWPPRTYPRSVGDGD